MASIIQVLKLGGSLLDLPDLAARLIDCRVSLGGAYLAMVVGGGPAADLVRGFDQRHALGSEPAHWLAIRAMQLNTHMLAPLLPHSRLVSDPDACQAAWETGDLGLVDPLAWLELEHSQGRTIPHRWSFTSDSIAAHVAGRLGAQTLTLLKSTLPPTACDVRRAAQLGLVDEDFPAACACIRRIEILDLRRRPLKKQTLEKSAS